MLYAMTFHVHHIHSVPLRKIILALAVVSTVTHTLLFAATLRISSFIKGVEARSGFSSFVPLSAANRISERSKRYQYQSRSLNLVGNEVEEPWVNGGDIANPNPGVYSSDVDNINGVGAGSVNGGQVGGDSSSSSSGASFVNGATNKDKYMSLAMEAYGQYYNDMSEEDYMNIALEAWEKNNGQQFVVEKPAGSGEDISGGAVVGGDSKDNDGGFKIFSSIGKLFSSNGDQAAAKAPQERFPGEEVPYGLGDGLRRVTTQTIVPAETDGNIDSGQSGSRGGSSNFGDANVPSTSSLIGDINENKRQIVGNQRWIDKEMRRDQLRNQMKGQAEPAEVGSIPINSILTKKSKKGTPKGPTSKDSLKFGSAFMKKPVPTAKMVPKTPMTLKGSQTGVSKSVYPKSRSGFKLDESKILSKSKIDLSSKINGGMPGVETSTVLNVPIDLVPKSPSESATSMPTSLKIETKSFGRAVGQFKKGGSKGQVGNKSGATSQPDRIADIKSPVLNMPKASNVSATEVESATLKGTNKVPKQFVSAGTTSLASKGGGAGKPFAPRPPSDFKTIRPKKSVGTIFKTLNDLKMKEPAAKENDTPFGTDDNAEMIADKSLPRNLVGEDDNVSLSPLDEPWLRSVSESDLPILHICKRIRSNKYGTTHNALFVTSVSSDGSFNAKKVVAKRPWSKVELQLNVPEQIADERRESDELVRPEQWEVDARATIIRKYWEVELHCHRKFEQNRSYLDRLRQQNESDERDKKGSEDKGSYERDRLPVVNPNLAVPEFKQVFPDDGNGDEDDTVPAYGNMGTDVWGESLDGRFEWLLYTSEMEASPTLSDALRHESRELCQHEDCHWLGGLQLALQLTPSDFSSVVDASIKSLLEDLFFLSSCNVVHRDLSVENVLCDGKNRRLRLLNFGNALDLDPPRVGLDNDDLTTHGPGSIASSLAADVFSVSVIVFQILFGVSGDAMKEQLKDAGYELDAWLKKAVKDSIITIDSPGFEYLKERRGMWRMLKAMVRPNPMRKKITADTLVQFNEVLSIKENEANLSGQVAERIQAEEAVFESIAKGETLIEDEKSRSDGDSKVLGVQGDESNEDDGFFDITTAPYQRPAPPQPSSPSIEEILQRQRAQAGFEEVDPSPRNAGFVDVTRPKFTSRRKSLLTDLMLSSKELPSAPEKSEIALKSNLTAKPSKGSNISNPKESPVISGSSKDVDDMVTIDIVAPSGRLGILVDDVDGPTCISEISANSPMADKLRLGDQIIAVDDEDVQGEYAHDITFLLLAKSANVARKITVMREAIVWTSENEEVFEPNQNVNLTASDQTPNDRHEEVEEWLMALIPTLQDSDLVSYSQCLVNDGFDCLQMLDALTDDDILFMKTAHRRVLSTHISTTMPERTVYTAEEALGEATRKGIEQIVQENRVASSKRNSQRKARERIEQLAQAQFVGRERLKCLTDEIIEIKDRVDDAREHIEEVSRIMQKDEARLRKVTAEEVQLRQKLDNDDVELREQVRQLEMERLDQELKEIDNMRRIKESQREELEED